MRIISEILIWGDQNDSSVIDFFLEKNILGHFIQYMKQKAGRCINYLLSNNHTNTIIAHQFDFSDEEVMAYYISFLKALSLRLNSETIHFFFNEANPDCGLYVEALKFFSHPESMVRIAVRTITLNVYRVNSKEIINFVHRKTAVPYFANISWSIGTLALDINSLVCPNYNYKARSKLEDLVAENLDYLHYINDILSLEIDCLNDVLCDQLLHRLFIPLHVYSLSKRHAFQKTAKSVCY
ncbi:unnamed protein product [Protopolystoma xenopodis]|uniref:FPL domain-containing protein n=1 Tax=Protopolystoma xenopodis TaxID=117903 RepID=A0A448X9C4_9PLAT|nr:unnamed protein product [Protopolystoma xenopodis]